PPPPPRRICWPLGADQPANAAHLTAGLGIAYELTAVRTGAHASKPLRRTGAAPACTLAAAREEMREVLREVFGRDGEQKRARVLELRGVAAGMWREGGGARAAAAQLLDAIAA
ncbi:hypothetical protein PsYK624_140020, partial [Phanerochaete sordida]